MSANRHVHTVATSKSIDEAVEAIHRKSSEKGFRVLHTHDFAATLAEKGIPREPLKVIEICNAKYASLVLEKDVEIASMLPCPISVFVLDGSTFISTVLPIAMTLMFPDVRSARAERDLERLSRRMLLRVEGCCVLGAGQLEEEMCHA